MPLFDRASTQLVQMLCLCLRPLSCLSKEVLFYQGDFPDGMFFLISGEVEVLVARQDSTEQTLFSDRTRCVAQLRPGSLILAQCSAIS